MVRIIQRRIKSVQSGGLDNNVLQYLHNITFDDRTSILGEGEGDNGTQTEEGTVWLVGVGRSACGGYGGMVPSKYLSR